MVTALLRQWSKCTCTCALAVCVSLVLLHTLIIVLGPFQPHCYSDCSTGAVVSLTDSDIFYVCIFGRH